MKSRHRQVPSEQTPRDAPLDERGKSRGGRGGQADFEKASGHALQDHPHPPLPTRGPDDASAGRTGEFTEGDRADPKRI